MGGWKSSSRGWAAAILASLVGVGADAAPADSEYTAEFRGLLEFVCGADPDRCLDREPPLTDSDLADLGAELARLVSASEARDVIEESVRIEADLLRLCAEDEARCRVWVEMLARAGSIDADLDGVLDGSDTCPGTSTAVARAQSILLAQQRALTEVREVMIELRRLLIVAANGTLGSVERFRLGEDAAGLFQELASIANAKEAGRYLFGGTSDDVRPFVLSGDFDGEAHPEVTYQGAFQPLRLPVGRSGESVPISIPGARLFLGDLDDDGTFPDPGGFDLFAPFVESREALHANDFERLGPILSVVDEAIGGPIAEAQRWNGASYAAVRRRFPERALTGVDPAGCSQEQFCASVRVGQPLLAEICSASDFLNDEPLLGTPRDCRVERPHGAEVRCRGWIPARHDGGKPLFKQSIPNPSIPNPSIPNPSRVDR